MYTEGPNTEDNEEVRPPAYVTSLPYVIDLPSAIALPCPRGQCWPSMLTPEIFSTGPGTAGEGHAGGGGGSHLLLVKTHASEGRLSHPPSPPAPSKGFLYFKAGVGALM